MPKYEITIVEETTRVATIEVAEGAEVDDELLDLAVDVSIENGQCERRFVIVPAADGASVDARA